MADKALMVVGQKRFVQTMRKAGADMDDLKEVNREAAQIALPAVRNLAPRGKTGRLAGSLRVGATKRAGVIRAGRKAVPYAGPTNYGWPTRTSGHGSSSTTVSPPPRANGKRSTKTSSTRH